MDASEGGDPGAWCPGFGVGGAAMVVGCVVSDREAIRRLERVRALRAQKPAAPAVSEEVVRQGEALAKMRRAVGGAAEAWATIAPDDLRDSAAVVHVKRGVLTLRCRDAAARYRVTGWLRSGGERGLIAAGVGVNRVRVV